MLAPTEMKKSPRSRPLNGSRSASSCTRYSLSARTTPATKVPSAGRKPEVLHQQGNADHEEERGGGEHFAQPRAGDVTKERTQDKATGQDNDRYGSEDEQRLLPARQASS